METFVESRELGRHSGYERVILKQSYRNKDGGYGLDSFDSGERPVLGFRKYGHEPSNSIKRTKFLANCNNIRFSRRNLLHGDVYDFVTIKKHLK